MPNFVSRRSRIWHRPACKSSQPFAQIQIQKTTRRGTLVPGREWKIIMEGDMRCVITAFVIVAFFIAPSYAALPSGIEFSSLDSISRWIANYRTKPNPARVPAAVRAMSQFGVFKDPESSGVYVGFIAGVLGANPDRAEELVGKMLPLPAADEWGVVRAIAHSN